jgi:hypothetical protein
MTTPTAPPKVARWLLTHFGFSPNNDAIIGDLDERYRQDHSRTWYWRQSLIAIITGLVALIRSNKLLTIRAVVTGWAVTFLLAPPLPYIKRFLRGSPTGTGFLPSSWTRVQWLYGRGWIVPQGDAYTFALISFIFAFLVGWLVGRLNRPNHRKAVMIFVASLFVCFLIASNIALVKVLQDWSSTSWRYDNPYFFVFGLVGGLLGMCTILAGGFFSGPPADSADGPILKRSA